MEKSLSLHRGARHTGESVYIDKLVLVHHGITYAARIRYRTDVTINRLVLFSLSDFICSNNLDNISLYNKTIPYLSTDLI